MLRASHAESSARDFVTLAPSMWLEDIGSGGGGGGTLSLQSSSLSIVVCRSPELVRVRASLSAVEPPAKGIRALRPGLRKRSWLSGGGEGAADLVLVGSAEHSLVSTGKEGLTSCDRLAVTTSME